MEPALAALFTAVADRARREDVFESVSIDHRASRVVAGARGSAEPAEYRLDVQSGCLCVSLVTPARYLSQSIEQDLVHQGDKIEDLLADELLDQESTVDRLPVEHFRSPDKLFTFRSPLPWKPSDWGQAATAEAAVKVLLAYEACFGPLGDLRAGEQE